MHPNLIFVAIIACVGLSAAHTIHGDSNMYTDTILKVYNSTCIETSGYPYVFLNNTKLDMNKVGEYDNLEILVEEISYGPETLYANIYLPKLI